MAESIDSDDGQHWTIKLKDGFTFHNGEPVNAESFLRGWNYAAYGPNATQVGFFFDKVEGYDECRARSPRPRSCRASRPSTTRPSRSPSRRRSRSGRWS